MLLFFKKAVPATSSGNAELAGYAGETVHYEAEGLAPVLFECFSTDDFTAGTLTVTLYKNGAAVSGGVVTLNDTTQRAAVQLSGVGYGPGDRLTVGWVSSSLAPTTADLVAVVA